MSVEISEVVRDFSDMLRAVTQGIEELRRAEIPQGQAGRYGIEMTKPVADRLRAYFVGRTTRITEEGDIRIWKCDGEFLFCVKPSGNYMLYLVTDVK